MRSEIGGRPLLAASLALAAGITALLHPLNLLFLPILLYFCGKKIPALIAACLGFLIGLLLGPANVNATASAGWSAIGTVATIPNLVSHGESFLFQTDNETVLVNLGGRQTLALGETLELSGVLAPIESVRLQGFALGGISGQVSVSPQNLHILAKAPVWFDLANRWRSSFLYENETSLNAHQAALVNALCFASARDLSKQTREDLSRVGVAHVLSVSGLQVFLLAFLIQFLLSQLPISRGVQVLVVTLALAFCATASGLHPATIRAVVMAVLTLAAYLFRREPDLLSALGLGAVATLIWQPWSVFTPGFQFSYVVVAALSLFWQRMQSSREDKPMKRVRRRLLQVVSMSFVATVAVAPLTAYHFGVVSLISPVSNLLVSPALPFIILVSMVAWPIGFVTPSIQAGLLKIVVGPLASWILMVTSAFGNQSWCAISWPPFNPYWIAVYYGGLLLLWQKTWRPRRDSNA
ncbi:MAG TPA: ComEC/Rec2 family competence protein [Fimbriimonadaceae bacterium]